MLKITHENGRIIIRSSENKPILCKSSNQVHSEYVLKEENFKGKDNYKEIE